MLFAVEFSLEALGIIGVLGSMLVAALVKMFFLLLSAKDDAIALKRKDDEQANTMAMAQQATTSLEIAAAKYAASIGKAIPEPLVAVVPKHNSPTTKEQREEAEMQTLQARITAATLALDQPARQAAAMESPEDAAVRLGKPQPTKQDVILDELHKIRLSQADDKAKVLIEKIAPAPTPVTIANEEPVSVKIEIAEKQDIAKAVVEAIESNVSPIDPRGKMMCGRLVKITGRTLEIEQDDGTPGTITVAPNASILLDGKKAKLSALEPGDKIEADDEPALAISATR